MEHPDIARTMLTGYPTAEHTEYETHARHCEVCGNGMNEGYLHEFSGECTCSGKCAAKLYPDKYELIEEGLLYWTDWYQEL